MTASVHTSARAAGEPVDDAPLISADSHVIEDPMLWSRDLDARWRERAPRFPAGAGRFAAHPGASDPHARTSEMAQDGVVAEVLYPTLALNLFKLDDAELQAACFRAYNDWLSQYCAVAPEKLVGIACIPLYDVDAGVRELERAKGLGCKGALVWEAPPAGLEFYTEHYERFWAAAQALEMPVSLHILTGHDWSKRVSDEAMTGVNLTEDERTALGEFRLRGVANYKLLTSINALHDLIMAGVLERYPQLKVVLVEAEIGWIPFVLNQWDKYYERPNMQFPEMRMSPSDYFARQVFATFFNDIPGTRQLSWWGQDNCMWSNDFPHPNSTWPHSHDIIRRDLAALSPDVQSRLLWRNCAELYGTPLPSAVETSP